MQIILRPVSDPRLQEIIVTGSRFAVGRNEEHFDSYDRTIVKKLSRRHARLFERDGRAFIVDLQSSNGTTVNGQQVEGEPVPLQVGDEVKFGDLNYRVERLAGTEAGTDIDRSADEAKVILEPVRSDAGLRAVVISKFPFLIGRRSSVFDGCESAEKQLSNISKKHAHLFLDGGAVHIEDLGSTNGTFVCGEQIAERSIALHDGDTVSFGNDFFTYAARVFIGSETVAGADSQLGAMPEGTVFVDDATNFFEIYMGAGDAEERAAGENGGSQGEDNKSDQATPGSSRLGRRMRFFRDIRGSLRAADPFEKRLRWTVGLAVLVLAGGLLGYWYLAWPVQRLERLLEQDDYVAAAEQANEYLAERSDDGRIRELATQALLKAVVPDWLAAVDAQDFSLAEEALSAGQAIGANNPETGELLGALELATKISAYDPSFTLSVDLLSSDASLGDLVEQWDAQDTQHARALSRVETHVDGFGAFQAAFYRQLRALRDRNQEVEPLQGLFRNVSAALADRDTRRLRQHVREFSERHSDLEGIGRLQEDLLRYEAIEQDIADTRWLNAYDRLNVSRFHTAPFNEHAAVINTEVLPDAATRDAYETAIAAWIEGNALECFRILEDLENERWGEDAKALLERNRKLLSEFVDLERSREAPNFEDRLFAFYGELDPELDEFLRYALQSDFQAHSESALARAANRFGEAERSWRQYDEAGRLNSVHRLEERVSAEYRQLAGLLTQAHEYLHEGEGIYAQLDRTAPENWLALRQSVVQEIKLQTRAIADLLVIEHDVQKAKLDLLPNLPGS